MKKIICLIVLFSMMLTCFMSCNSTEYKKALELAEKEDYEGACAIFEELGDYKDSKERAKSMKSRMAFNFRKNGDYESAYALYKEIEAVEFCKMFYYVPTYIKHKIRDTETVQNFYYNEANFLSQIVTVDQNNKQSRIDYTYKNGEIAWYIMTDHEERQSICHYGYDYDTGELATKKFTDHNFNEQYTNYIYDKKGRLFYESSGSSDHSAGHCSTEYIYDESDNLIERIHTHYPSKEKEINYYTYDKNGNLIKDVLDSCGLNKHIMEYSYDADGKMIRKLFIHPDGDEYTYDYIYDSKGNLIKKIYNQAGSDYREITDYFYDENNNLVKLVYRGNITRVEEWTYDENENLIKYVKSDGEKEIELIEYKYKFVYMPIFWDSISESTKEILSEKLVTKPEIEK